MCYLFVAFDRKTTDTQLATLTFALNGEWPKGSHFKGIKGEMRHEYRPYVYVDKGAKVLLLGRGEPAAALAIKVEPVPALLWTFQTAGYFKEFDEGRMARSLQQNGEVRGKQSFDNHNGHTLVPNPRLCSYSRMCTRARIDVVCSVWHHSV